MHSFDSDTTEGKKSNCMQHFVITMWLLDKGYLKKNRRSGNFCINTVKFLHKDHEV